MKLNFFKFILLFSIITFLSSCLGTTDTIVVSNDATFVSLTLAKNDSVKLASFTLVGDTIVNLDSLPFNTIVDAVYPTFSFKSSGGAKLYFKAGSKKDSVGVTGKDTVDFTNPVRIRNYASNLVNYIDYVVKVNVHKVQPELYVWKNLGETLPQTAINQKTIIRNDSLFYYSNDGSVAYLFTSKNGSDWKSKAITGFPTGSSINDITQFNGKFYVTQDAANIYSSSNGINWSKKAVSTFNFKSLLFAFDNKLWAVAQLPDLSCHFATSADGDNWSLSTINFPVDFPVRGFTSLSFATRTGKPKVLVLGGYKVDNTYVTSNWSSEDCKYWVNFSSSNSNGQHSLDSLAPGASVISYDKKILLFGAVLRNSQIKGNYFRESIDEGLSWQVPSKTYNQMREGFASKSPITQKDTVIYTNFPVRSYQSVVVDSSYRIYIVGGKTDVDMLRDVWTGKLNRKSFLLQ
jgi:hypothetical protein